MHAYFIVLKVRVTRTLCKQKKQRAVQRLVKLQAYYIYVNTQWRTYVLLRVRKFCASNNANIKVAIATDHRGMHCQQQQGLKWQHVASCLQS